MIFVMNEVNVYEVRGKPTRDMDIKEVPTFGVYSHSINNEMVVVSSNNGLVTVLASDLIAAIKNATNSNRF